MCWGSAGVAVVLLALFVLDFIMKMTGSTTFRPFGALDYVVDVVCSMAAAILIYLSIDALRDLR